MKRAIATLVVIAGIGVAWIVVTGTNSDKDTYWAQFDNAFGLIKGGDMKVAGVRAGKITAIKLDKRTKHALVGFKVDRGGFGSLRTDASCESRPQSLIGEYFIDCQPGTAKQELKPGATIPVAHTASTVAPDLVTDILRRPYRERLSLIIGSLGAGVAGNAANLNAAIRRASPALRETDKVLAMLGGQNRVLSDLTVNADKVVGDLAANRKDVGRFVTKARQTAQASAERRTQLAAGFRELPGFLEQLTPTMKALGNVADDQTSALRNLDASSKQLTNFFDQLGPFADASRPAFRALGAASQTGDRAVKAAPPVISQLGAFSKGTPELGKNLAIILQHLDDRRYSAEKDPRSPGGQGYTGLEAPLQYLFDQTESTAIFDQNNHILKIGAFGGPCNYASEETLRKNPSLETQCGSRLGPNQPGLNFPDPTKRAQPDNKQTARDRAVKKRADGKPDLPRPPAPKQDQQPSAPSTPSPSAPATPQTPQTPTVPTPSVPPVQVPPLPIPNLPPLPKIGGDPQPPSTNSDQRSDNGQPLLDYLLKP